jgi:hypothetical protein
LRHRTKHVYQSVDSVRWKPRAISTWFKHFGVLAAVAVYLIESWSKQVDRHSGNSGECGTALFDCEVHLFSTSRKNWRNIAVCHYYLKVNLVNFLIFHLCWFLLVNKSWSIWKLVLYLRRSCLLPSEGEIKEDRNPGGRMGWTAIAWP